MGAGPVRQRGAAQKKRILINPKVTIHVDCGAVWDRWCSRSLLVVTGLSHSLK